MYFSFRIYFMKFNLYLSTLNSKYIKNHIFDYFELNANIMSNTKNINIINKNNIYLYNKKK